MALAGESGESAGLGWLHLVKSHGVDKEIRRAGLNEVQFVFTHRDQATNETASKTSMHKWGSGTLDDVARPIKIPVTPQGFCIGPP